MAKAKPIPDVAAPVGGLRSNLFLTPELKARIDRVAEAFAKQYGDALSSPQIQRMALGLGLTTLEARLGLEKPAAEPGLSDVAPGSDAPRRRARGGSSPS